MIKSPEFSFALNYLYISILIFCNNPLWATVNSCVFVRLKLCYFDNLISLIETELTCYNKHHLVSTLHHLLVLMTHEYYQEVHMDKLLYLFYQVKEKLGDSTIPKDESKYLQCCILRWSMWMIMVAVINISIRGPKIPYFHYHMWYMIQDMKKVTA